MARNDKKDWLMMQLEFPNFEVEDFQRIGNMSLDNTSFLSRDEYMENPAIRNIDAFKDDSGRFSEEKFGEFYDQAASSFRRFSTNSLEDSYEYSMWDTARPVRGRVKNPEFRITHTLNPDHHMVGVAGFNETTEGELGWRELAQRSRIHDTKTGKDLDFTVNDMALEKHPGRYFVSLFKDPLVYATYDEDTEETNPVTGQVEKHYKGERKLNRYGEYFTETLNGRSTIGKQVVTAGDYITVDGSTMNKVDFLDSDDKKKSTAGIIVKNVVNAALYLNPYTGPVMTGFIITRDLAEITPMLANMIVGGLTDKEIENPFFNRMEAYGKRFRLGASDAGSESMLSFENIMNLASDVVGMVNKQTAIAKGITNALGKGEKTMVVAQEKAAREYVKESERLYERAMARNMNPSVAISNVGTANVAEIPEMLRTGAWRNTPIGAAALRKYIPAAQREIDRVQRLARNMSLAYMAMHAGTITFDAVKEHGATPREAALITLGTICGMYSVDRYLGLGELMFDPMGTRMALTNSVREVAGTMVSNAGIGRNLATEQGIVSALQAGVRFGKRVVNRFFENAKHQNLGYAGKALGSGLEQVVEQVADDTSRTIAETLGKMGFASQTDYGAWDNMFERYTMNFLGGVFGGGMAYLKSLSPTARQARKAREAENDLINVLVSGRVKVDEVYKEIDRLAARGELGSTRLSMEKHVVDGKDVYLTADNGRQSQSEVLSQRLKDHVNVLNTIINGDNLNITEDGAIERLANGMYRRLALADMMGHDPETFKATMFLTRFQDDVMAATRNIVEKEQELANLRGNTRDAMKREDGYKDREKQLVSELEALKAEREYLFGKGSLGYIEKTLFALDPETNMGTVTITKQQMARQLMGKSYGSLTDSEKVAVDEQFNRQSDFGTRSLDEAFRLFKAMQGELNPTVQGLADDGMTRYMEAAREFHTIMREFMDATRSPLLEGETEESLRATLARREGETDKQYNDRIAAFNKSREERIGMRNAELFDRMIDRIDSLELSSQQRRYLMTFSSSRIQEVNKAYVNNLDNGDFSNSIMGQVMDIYRNVDFSDPTSMEQARQKVINEVIPASGLTRRYHVDASESVVQILADMLADHSGAMPVEEDITYDDAYRLAMSIARERREQNAGEGATPMEFDPSTVTVAELREALGVMKEGFSDAGLSDNPFVARILNGIILTYVNSHERADADNAAKYIPTREEHAVLRQDVEDNYNAVAGAEKDATYISTSNENNGSEGTVMRYVPKDLGDNVQLFIGNRETILPSSERAEAERNAAKARAFDENHPFVESLRRAHAHASHEPMYMAQQRLLRHNWDRNPIFPLLKKVADMRGEKVDIESLLHDIGSMYETVADIGDFTITDEQRSALQRLVNDLGVARTFLYAASVRETYENPVGHNKAVNDYVRARRDVFPDVAMLPELDEDFATFLMNEIDAYANEVGRWIELADSVRQNKLKMFTNGSNAYNKARIEFVAKNRDAFRLSDDVDLLDGIEDIDGDVLKGGSFSDTLVVGELLARNYRKAIASGKTLDWIMTKLFMPADAGGKGLVDIKRLPMQEMATLDESIKYENITDYDKWQFVIGSFALADSEFYNGVLAFIGRNSNMAPLHLQEIVARAAVSSLVGSPVINEALDFVAKKTGTILPVLPNTAVVTGVGGAGKTFAISRIATSFLKEGDRIWLSAPGETQVKALKGLIPQGDTKTIDELMALALGEQRAKDLAASIKKDGSGKWTTTGEFVVDKVRDAVHTVNMKGGIKVNKTKDAPRLVVIDEATWIDTAKLLVLSRWAQENGTCLLLVGDVRQNGSQHGTLMGNMSVTDVLAWRSPDLFMSLRTANRQKNANLTPIANEINRTLHIVNTEEIRSRVSDIRERLSRFRFSHYIGNGRFNGELIVDRIPDDVMTILWNASNNETGKIVAFIGDTSSSIHKALVDRGVKFKVMTPQEVQGSEFDYVVVDKDWDFNERNPMSYIRALQDLYTMVSRSRSGTVIIDNGLSDHFGNVRDDSTGEVDIISGAIVESTRNRTAEITEALGRLNGIFGEGLTETAPTRETTPVTRAPQGSREGTSGEPPAGEGPSERTDTNPDGTKAAVEASEGSGIADGIEGQGIKSEVISGSENRARYEGEATEESSDACSDITPYRVYGNVHMRGISELDDGTWSNATGSSRDLGIFLGQGENVSTWQAKDDLVRKLLQLKSLLLFSTEYYDKAHADLRNLFTKEALDNVEYWVDISDPTDINKLVGMTSLRNDSRRIGGTAPDGSDGKVVTLVARIKGNDGKTYEVTLGGFANPRTWINNEGNIRASITRRIEKLKARLDNDLDPNSSDYDAEAGELTRSIDSLTQYLSNLSGHMQAYSDSIGRAVANGKGYRINTPRMTRMTSLVRLDGDPLRMEALPSRRGNAGTEENDVTTRAAWSPYDASNKYMVRSEVYIPYGDAAKWVDSSVIGKAVVFVSSNVFLSGSELAEMYCRQKNDPSIMPQVRMVVLDNLGVSFRTLCSPTWRELYKGEYMRKGQKHVRQLPFNSQYQGINMYQALWNFRADLTNFVEEYQEFCQHRLTDTEEEWNAYARARGVRPEDIDRNEITNAATLEDIQYVAYRDSVRIDSGNPGAVPSHESFVSHVEELHDNGNISDTTYAACRLIWKFNDGLCNHRRFRLGHSLANGVYVRRLTNMKESHVYRNVENPTGLYINGDMAIQYLGVINALFSNVIDRILPMADSMAGRTRERMSLDRNDRSWYKKVKNAGLSFDIIDASGNMVMDDGTPCRVEIAGNDFDQLSMLPTALVAVVQRLNAVRMSDASRSPRPIRMRIDGNDIDIDWVSILQALTHPNGGNGVVRVGDHFDGECPGVMKLDREDIRYLTNVASTLPLTDSEVCFDNRIMNMFDVMFHGRVLSSQENDLRGNAFRASDCMYPYGIFVDPMRVSEVYESSPLLNKFFLMQSNAKFYAADVTSGFPLVMASLAPYSPEADALAKEQMPVMDAQTNDLHMERPAEKEVVDRKGSTEGVTSGTARNAEANDIANNAGKGRAASRATETGNGAKGGEVESKGRTTPTMTMAVTTTEETEVPNFNIEMRYSDSSGSDDFHALVDRIGALVPYARIPRFNYVNDKPFIDNAMRFINAVIQLNVNVIGKMIDDGADYDAGKCVFLVNETQEGSGTISISGRHLPVDDEVRASDMVMQRMDEDGNQIVTLRDGSQYRMSVTKKRTANGFTYGIDITKIVAAGQTPPPVVTDTGVGRGVEGAGEGQGRGQEGQAGIDGLTPTAFRDMVVDIVESGIDETVDNETRGDILDYVEEALNDTEGLKAMIEQERESDVTMGNVDTKAFNSIMNNIYKVLGPIITGRDGVDSGSILDTINNMKKGC